VTAALPVPEPPGLPSSAESTLLPADLLLAARTWFTTADLLLIGGAPEAQALPILAGWGASSLPAILPLAPDHPLRTLWRDGGHLVLDLATTPAPLFSLPGDPLLELAAVRLNHETLLLRGARTPGHRIPQAERLLLELLGASGSSVTPMSGLADWRGDLATQLLYATDESQLLQSALEALAQLFPGGTCVLWELDDTDRQLRSLGSLHSHAESSSAGDWQPVSGRLLDALLLDRPLTDLQPARDQWLAEAAHHWPVPRDPFVVLWPCGGLGDSRLYLLLGQAAPYPWQGIAGPLQDWSDLLRRAITQHRQLTQLRQEASQRAQELSLAATIQRSLLPADAEIDGWHLAVYHTTDSELAGDFVLAERSADLLHLAVGDVAGRGVPASLTMMAAYSLLLSRLGRSTSLAEVLTDWSAELNRLTERNQERGGDLSYTTLLLVRLDLGTGQVQFGKAGHPYPLHYHGVTGEVTSWDAMGYPAGLFEEQEFETPDQVLAHGDSLVLYTDGFSEAGESLGHFGVERMTAILQTFGDFPAPIIREQLLEALHAHLRGHPVGDDTTLVVLSRNAGVWQQRAQVPLEKVADILQPAAAWAAHDTGARQEIEAALAQLPLILPEWLGAQQLTGGYTLRVCHNNLIWHGALTLPGLTARIPAGEIPSRCMAYLLDDGQLWRRFAQAMDFLWVNPQTSELHFIRRANTEPRQRHD